MRVLAGLILVLLASTVSALSFNTSLDYECSALVKASYDENGAQQRFYAVSVAPNKDLNYFSISLVDENSPLIAPTAIYLKNAVNGTNSLLLSSFTATDVNSKTVALTLNFADKNAIAVTQQKNCFTTGAYRQFYLETNPQTCTPASDSNYVLSSQAITNQCSATFSDGSVMIYDYNLDAKNGFLKWTNTLKDIRVEQEVSSNDIIEQGNFKILVTGAGSKEMRFVYTTPVLGTELTSELCSFDNERDLYEALMNQATNKLVDCNTQLNSTTIEKDSCNSTVNTLNQSIGICSNAKETCVTEKNECENDLEVKSELVGSKERENQAQATAMTTLKDQKDADIAEKNTVLAVITGLIALFIAFQIYTRYFAKANMTKAYEAPDNSPKTPRLPLFGGFGQTQPEQSKTSGLPPLKKGG